MAKINWSEVMQIMQTQMSRSATAVSDGGYLIVGDGQDSSTPRKGVIVKIPNPEKELGIMWDKCFGGKFDCFFKGVAELKDGSIVATGISFYSAAAGDEDVWIVKMDKDGNKLFENVYGNKGEKDDGVAVKATSDGGFIVCGFTLVNNIPSIWVLKFTSDCTLTWQKKIIGKVAFDIIETHDGGYILSGGIQADENLNSNIYAIKLDANGNKVWDKEYSQQVYVMQYSGITGTSDNEYVIVSGKFVIKIDDTGKLIWNREYPDCVINSVLEMRDGTLFAVGSSVDSYNFEHAYVMAMNAAGEIIWDNASILATGWGASAVSYNKSTYVAVGTLPHDAFSNSMFICDFISPNN